MMPKVWNKRDPETPTDAVYVGRPSKWGNPFVIGRDGDRDEVIEAYEHWLDHQMTIDPWFLRGLKGKDLVCWCVPEACHADVLLEIANA
jgi:hypothetical protein